MPLEVRPVRGRNEFFACSIPKCIQRGSRRVMFMGHDMGNICTRHVKEWEQAWTESTTPPVDA